MSGHAASRKRFNARPRTKTMRSLRLAGATRFLQAAIRNAGAVRSSEIAWSTHAPSQSTFRLQTLSLRSEESVARPAGITGTGCGKFVVSWICWSVGSAFVADAVIRNMSKLATHSIAGAWNRLNKIAD